MKIEEGGKMRVCKNDAKCDYVATELGFHKIKNAENCVLLYWSPQEEPVHAASKGHVKLFETTQT